MKTTLVAILATTLLHSETHNTETAMTRAAVQEMPVAQATYQEISDASGLVYLNPDLKERRTAKIRLPNGLEVLLISDPGADQSSACMAVEAGSWSDPAEYPGMAHFCEHMLFMGTEKYPDCNAFFNQVSDAGGQMNAFTATDRTVYMFSSKLDGYLSILDRFARFFIDPLFDQNNISRELHAVDQEFSKNIENDNWREYMIFKETCTAGHPNQKFSTGNSETLANIPPSALRAWHTKHYGANKMHLFLYSSLPLNTMKEQAALLFAAVPTLEQDISIPYQPILSSQQKGHITYIKPIQNKQTLTLTWELPQDLSDEDSQSADLVAYALARGQEHNLYESLKKDQFIDGFLPRSDDLGSRLNGSFSFTLELSPKGIAHYKEVIQRCFEALAGLRASGIPAYLQEEKNAVAKLSYEYQSRQDAFQMAQNIGQALPDEPLSTFPQKQVLATEYSPTKIQAVLSKLTPDSCSIYLAASPLLTAVIPDRTEKWFGAEYAIRPIPADWLEEWKGAKPNAAIRLAEPNPFLPTNLKLAQIDARDATPVLVSQTESGTAYYCRAPEFSAPETSIQLSVRSPLLESSAKSAVLAALYLDHLTDELHPITSAAQSAGLSPRFDFDKLKLKLSIYGFSEKAPLLLKQILQKLDLQAPTPEQFETYVARHAKIYSNGSKELPLRQAKELLLSVLSSDQATQTEKLHALHSITYEDYLDFQSKLFDETYAEALFTGNLTFKQAESSWIDVQHILSKGIYPQSHHTRSKVLELPSQGGPFAMQRTTEIQGNAVILAVDEGTFNLEKRSAQDILSPALRESFFNELRTKQKTGYIAHTEPAELEDELFHYFMVQSNSHQPEDLLYRFELFLEEYLHTLPESITPARFETLKASCIHSLKTRYRNLRDKAALWNLLAFEKGADFQFIDKRIQHLNQLSYDRFQKLTQEMLSRTNLKRLAILYEGRLPAPFAYEPVDKSKLLELGHYVAKEDRKSSRE